MRLDRPIGGKRKLGPILRKPGFAVSDACGGRSVGELILRDGVAKVPALVRKAPAGFASRAAIAALEHVPKKLLDFFDQDMLQLFRI